MCHSLVLYLRKFRFAGRLADWYGKWSSDPERDPHLALWLRYEPVSDRGFGQQMTGARWIVFELLA